MKSFKLGDLTVYPNHGVGEIKSIEERPLGSMSVKCYVVDMVSSDSKVFVPVTSALRMGLRNISSKNDIDGVYTLFKHKSPELLKMNWNKRYEGKIDKEAFSSASLNLPIKSSSNPPINIFSP